MKKLFFVIAAIATLSVGGARAFLPATHGGLGAPAAVGGYQGPGDIISGAAGFWSCSRAYSASYAASTGNMCDFNDAVSGTFLCTLKAATTGFADVTGTYCTGAVSIVTICVTNGCTVSKVYDQTGSSNDMVQATNANRPSVVFSGDPTGTLPVMFNSSSSSSVTINTSSTPTFTQPIFISGVYIRTSGIVQGSILANVTNTVYMNASGVANKINVFYGSLITPTTLANDNAWHAVSTWSGPSNNSGAINIDGTDLTGQAMGTNGSSGTGFRLFRFAGSNEMLGKIAEAIIYNNTTTTSTDRGNLYSNQHGSNGYGAF